jgi:hypothetical protein
VTGHPLAQVPHVKHTSAHSGAARSLLCFGLIAAGSIQFLLHP